MPSTGMTAAKIIRCAYVVWPIQHDCRTGDAAVGLISYVQGSKWLLYLCLAQLYHVEYVEEVN